MNIKLYLRNEDDIDAGTAFETLALDTDREGWDKAAYDFIYTAIEHPEFDPFSIEVEGPCFYEVIYDSTSPWLLPVDGTIQSLTALVEDEELV